MWRLALVAAAILSLNSALSAPGGPSALRLRGGFKAGTLAPFSGFGCFPWRRRRATEQHTEVSLNEGTRELASLSEEELKTLMSRLHLVKYEAGFRALKEDESTFLTFDDACRRGVEVRLEELEAGGVPLKLLVRSPQSVNL
jgi:hypothetical protein